MWTLILAAAFAVEPNVEIVGDDLYVGTVSLAIAPDELRKRMTDPRDVSKINGGKTTVTIVEKDGECLVLDYLSPNAILDVRYRLKRCPTATGWVASLIESDAFSEYATKWTLTPEGDGTLLRYELKLVSDIRWVPNSIVRSSTRKGVMKFMKDFGNTFGVLESTP